MVIQNLGFLELLGMVCIASLVQFNQADVLFFERSSVENSNVLSNDEMCFFLLLHIAYIVVLATQDQYGVVRLLGVSSEFFHPFTGDDFYFLYQF